MISAKEAILKMEEGNRKYLTLKTGGGDISPAVRLRTCRNGQQPYAIVIACSDSRVIPESIFSAGIGELFTIRVAGNVIDDHQLGSIEYAVEHLGTNLVVVMGHTGCGAVEAAIHHEPSGYIKYITDEISLAIGEEKDPYRASCLNVMHSIRQISDALLTPPTPDRCDYHIDRHWNFSAEFPRPRWISITSATGRTRP